MTRIVLALLLLTLAVGAGFAAEKENRVFELRVYTPNPGKQSEVTALIANSGVKYMTKHQITLVGSWVPTDAADERVLTLVAHADKASAEKNWDAFRNDASWKAELEAASKNGRAVSSLTSFFLKTTDYSPELKPATVGSRVFELRTYITTPKNLGNLNARFRDHTVKLFEKHGMTNIAYFTLGDAEKTNCGDLLKGLAAAGKDKADVAADSAANDVALVYFLTHKSADAMKESFGKFGADEAWKAARMASEKNAGGSLTAKDGVKSLLLKPTDFSPLK